jgi:signal recognition particle subunit SRP54
MVAPIMKSMAGKGIAGRMQAIRELQQAGLFDPGGKKTLRVKKGTGKRLTSKERAKLKKQRDRDERRKRREEKGR